MPGEGLASPFGRRRMVAASAAQAASRQLPPLGSASFPGRDCMRWKTLRLPPAWLQTHCCLAVSWLTYTAF